MLKNDTLKTGTSRKGSYGSAPPPGLNKQSTSTYTGRQSFAPKENAIGRGVVLEIAMNHLARAMGYLLCNSQMSFCIVFLLG